MAFFAMSIAAYLAAYFAHFLATSRLWHSLQTLYNALFPRKKLWFGINATEGYLLGQAA